MILILVGGKMSKIYVPTDYLNKPCYVVNNDYIRVYNSINNNYNVVYDIYFNNDYMIRESTASYSSSTRCDNINTYTDDIYYRTDFYKILLIFIIFAYICYWLPWKILCRLFRRFN